MRIRSFLLACCVAVPVLGAVPTGARRAAAAVPAMGRAAVVDLQAVLERTKHGKRSRKKLEKAVADKQKQLDRERARIEAELSRIGKLPPKDRAEAQRRLQEASVKWQQDAMGFEAEMAKMESDMLEAIYRNVEAIVEQICKERGIDVVFVKDQMTIVYVDPSLDLTDEVVRRYDKAHK